MLRKGTDGTIYLVETTETAVSRETLQDASTVLGTEIASLQAQLDERTARKDAIDADLAVFDDLAQTPVEPAPVEAPAEPTPVEPTPEPQPSVDDLIPDNDSDDTATPEPETPETPETPAEPTPVADPEEVSEPFDGGAEAPQTNVDSISLEQAVEQGL